MMYIRTGKFKFYLSPVTFRMLTTRVNSSREDKKTHTISYKGLDKIPSMHYTYNERKKEIELEKR